MLHDRKIVKGSVKHISKASKSDRELIGRTLLPHIEEYFKRPGVEEDFQLWLAQRNKKLCLM